MTLLGERAFDAVDENAVFDDHDSGTYTFTTDATAPKSPPNVAQAFYPTGFSSAGVGAGATVAEGFTSQKNLYACYWVKYSSNFYGHSAGVNKISYIWTNTNNPSLYFQGAFSDTQAIVPTITGQDIVVPNTPEIEWSPNIVPSKRLIRGQWHLFEHHVIGNSVGASDGEIKWWIDGVLTHDITGVAFNAAASVWSVFKLTSVWGGVGGPNVPADQYMNFDHLYVSTKA